MIFLILVSGNIFAIFTKEYYFKKHKKHSDIALVPPYIDFSFVNYAG